MSHHKSQINIIINFDITHILRQKDISRKMYKILNIIGENKKSKIIYVMDIF